MDGLCTAAPEVLTAQLASAVTAGFADVKKRVNTVGGGSTGSVRNLRIREDTAKYLLNLDLDSAYYDPKTRSMREDPQPHKDPKEKVRCAGGTHGGGGGFWLGDDRSASAARRQAMQ